MHRCVALPHRRVVLKLRRAKPDLYHCSNKHRRRTYHTCLVERFGFFVGVCFPLLPSTPGSALILPFAGRSLDKFWSESGNVFQPLPPPRLLPPSVFSIPFSPPAPLLSRSPPAALLFICGRLRSAYHRLHHHHQQQQQQRKQQPKRRRSWCWRFRITTRLTRVHRRTAWAFPASRAATAPCAISCASHENPWRVTSRHGGARRESAGEGG